MIARVRGVIAASMPAGSMLKPAGIDRDDGCPAGGNRKPGSDEGVAGHDDLIAWADAGGAQCEDQRFKPVTHANTVPGPAVVGKLILECLKLSAENVMGCRPHAGQGGV